MIRIAAKTKLSPEEVIKQAVDFFGPSGHKLEVTSQTSTAACFERYGTGVGVAARAEEKGTSVELVSQEWDYQVYQFIDKIGGSKRGDPEKVGKGVRLQDYMGSLLG